MNRLPTPTSRVKHYLLNVSLLAVCFFLVSTTAQAQAGQTQYNVLETASGKQIPYAVHLPDGFDPTKTYPVLIGPGEGIEGEDPGFYWKTDPYSHNWIIVDAPLWKTESSKHIDELLNQLLQDHQVEGRKFHAVCWSANSAGIFQLVVNNADLFHSITGMAGNPSRISDADISQYGKLNVQFVVGENDIYWQKTAQDSYKRLFDAGVNATIEIVPNGEHVMKNLIGLGFMQRMDAIRDR